MPQYVSIALKDNIIERIKTSEIYEFFNYNKDKYEEFLKKKLIKINQLNVLFAVFVTGKKNVKKFGLKKII